MSFKRSIVILSFMLAGCSRNIQQKHFIDNVIQPPSSWSTNTNNIPFQNKKKSQWMIDFKDPVLTEFLTVLIKNNPDLASSFIRIKEASNFVDLSSSNKLPIYSVGLNHNISKKWNTGLPSQRNWSTSQMISYEADIWGKISASTNAAIFEKNATEYDYDALKLKIIATFVELYWKQQYYISYLYLLDNEIAHAKYLSVLSNTMYNLGSIALQDKLQSELRLQELIHNRDSIIKSQEEGARAMSIILGQNPTTSIISAIKHENIYPEVVLPSLMPSDLLNNRPDIKAAEARLLKDFYKSEEARLSIYPTLSFSLSQSTGNNRNLMDLLKDPIATLTNSITFPIFNYPQNKIKIKISQNQFEQAKISFKNSYLLALKEVEDLLSAYDYYYQNSLRFDSILAKDAIIVDITENAYLEGSISYKDLMDQRQSFLYTKYENIDNQVNYKLSMLKLYMSITGSVNFIQ